MSAASGGRGSGGIARCPQERPWPGRCPRRSGPPRHKGAAFRGRSRPWTSACRRCVPSSQRHPPERRCGPTRQRRIPVKPLSRRLSAIWLQRDGRLLGYARVSTGDQDAALQQDALRAVGCYRVFTDTASGSLESRPELTKVLDQLRPGDTLVVWRLDRLGRSIRHLIDQLADLQDRGSGSGPCRKRSTRPPRAGGWSFTCSQPLRSSNGT